MEHIAQKLSMMIDESAEELVHEALKRAVETNARNKVKYADAILRSWNSQRLKTLDDVAAAERALARRNQTQKYNNKPVREEMLPEWLNQPEDEKLPETVPPDNTDWEAEKQKVLADLAAKKAIAKGVKS